MTFEGAVEPLAWGRVDLHHPAPADRRRPSALAAAGARRVEGEIDEHPVNLALSRAPVVEGVFLWAGQSLLDRIGIAPGERLEVRLRPAPDDAVDTPDDVAAALRRAGRTGAWEALTPGKRRGLLYQIDTAKTAGHPRQAHRRPDRRPRAA